MKTAIIALTPNASRLAITISALMESDIYIKSENAADFTDYFPLDCPLKEKIGLIWEKYDEIIFIMATGIVVRTIAPYLRSKTIDPAVVCMDEKGHYIISLLSGHFGGANELAEKLAKICGGQPVVTTATDVNSLPAFDDIARRNNLFTENNENIVHISSALLKGKQVYLYSQLELIGELPENVLQVMMKDLPELPQGSPVVFISNLDASDDSGSLYSKILKRHKVFIIRPRNIVVGSGCQKDIDSKKYMKAIDEFLLSNCFSPLSVKCLGSASVKANEKCMLDFCRERKAEFKTFTKDEMKVVDSLFEQSEFVKNTVGVGNVADSCAALASGQMPIICKTDLVGITASMAITKEQLKI